MLKELADTIIDFDLIGFNYLISLYHVLHRIELKSHITLIEINRYWIA
jgi:hypothetical protein